MARLHPLCYCTTLAFSLPAQWVAGASAAVACLTAANWPAPRARRVSSARRSDSGQRNSPGLNAQPGAPARALAGASHGACNAQQCSPRLAQVRPSSQPTAHRLLKKHSDECGTGDTWQAGHDAVIGDRVFCAVRVTLCVSGIVRAVHQSSSKLGDTPLARLDLFESLPSRRFGCRASTTNSTAKSRSTSLYNAPASSRGGCVELYSSTALQSALHLLQLYSALHSTSSIHPPSKHSGLKREFYNKSSLARHWARDWRALALTMKRESKNKCEKKIAFRFACVIRLIHAQDLGLVKRVVACMKTTLA